MIKLKIDNREFKVPEGLSVLGAARMNGIEIPSMCYREGKPHFTSCMICMVKDRNSGKLIPSCSVKALEGMDIISIDEEVKEARTMALDLLLSEHVGDCEAPCQITCPAHMDIPLMNRLLAEGKNREALAVVKKDIALPAVFGYICPAPCEGACRRKSIDSAVSICMLKRYAGTADLEAQDTFLPEKQADSGKKVAIVGAGPAGLAAAYYLQLRGHACVVYDRNEKAGGSLWTEVENGKLPAAVLEKEISLIESLGVNFELKTEVGSEKYETICKTYDAVLLATGEMDESIAAFGLAMTAKGIETSQKSYQTSNQKVFAAGSVQRKAKLAIRTLGQGKEAAFSVDQFLKGKEVTGEPMLFNSRFGKLLPEEIMEYRKESDAGERIVTADHLTGYTVDQVKLEAERCLHCDCRAIDDCQLRLLSDEYSANQKHYWSEERKQIRKHTEHDFVIYEPNKCIKCGKCVHITEEHKEKFGLSFIGRGFDVVIGVPFNEAIKNGLVEVAKEVIDACPTGALSSK